MGNHMVNLMGLMRVTTSTLLTLSILNVIIANRHTPLASMVEILITNPTGTVITIAHNTMDSHHHHHHHREMYFQGILFTQHHRARDIRPSVNIHLRVSIGEKGWGRSLISLPVILLPEKERIDPIETTLMLQLPHHLDLVLGLDKVLGKAQDRDKDKDKHKDQGLDREDQYQTNKLDGGEGGVTVILDGAFPQVPEHRTLLPLWNMDTEVVSRVQKHHVKVITLSNLLKHYSLQQLGLDGATV